MLIIPLIILGVFIVIFIVSYLWGDKIARKMYSIKDTMMEETVTEEKIEDIKVKKKEK